MTLEEANNIVNVWGKYLEHCSGRLNMLFLHDHGKIPESLLPYPKSVLENALDIMDRHFYDIGSKHGMEIMRETKILLELYGDDADSLKYASEMFGNLERRNKIISVLKNWQKTWLETQKS